MIVLENVSKCFMQGVEEVSALSLVSLHVKRGEYVVLKGSSGSGKSTLLSLIAGLQKPTSGLILVENQAVAKLSEAYSAKFRRETLGFIFQKYHLILNLSVEENIALALIPMNVSLQDVKQKVKRVMEQFHISHKAKTLTKHLSGGEQQRTAIARALVCEPKILLADEPTANLDATLSEALMTYLEAQKKEGLTIVLATHDPLLVEQACVDRVIELKNGCIIS